MKKKKLSRRSFLTISGGTAAASMLPLWQPSRIIAETSAGALRAAPAAYQEPPKEIPSYEFDVVIAGAGSAGAIAGIAAARQGAKTCVIERKGYSGGTISEGGTALHSFFNLWQEGGVPKRQVVQGIPQEVISALEKINGTTGHALQTVGWNYDNVCTSVDTELYKLVTLNMMTEAGATLLLNTAVTGAIVSGSKITGVIVEGHGGRMAVMAKQFIDTSKYGDLAAYAGAEYTVPDDYAECNSIGVSNCSIDDWHATVANPGQVAVGRRSGVNDKIVRSAHGWPGYINMPSDISGTITAVHDNHMLFVKVGVNAQGTVLDRDVMADAELECRQKQYTVIQEMRKLPNSASAFICRTSPTLCIRRGRRIVCDYDITMDDIYASRKFPDDTFMYGFHDNGPSIQVGHGNGGTYGIPYRAFLAAGLDNLFVGGMMITNDHTAHMSTRNTVSCMGQGQAIGTAAALCADKGVNSRQLAYSDLKSALLTGDVYFE